MFAITTSVCRTKVTASSFASSVTERKQQIKVQLSVLSMVSLSTSSTARSTATVQMEDTRVGTKILEPSIALQSPSLAQSFLQTRSMMVQCSRTQSAMTGQGVLKVKKINSTRTVYLSAVRTRLRYTKSSDA